MIASVNALDTRGPALIILHGEKLESYCLLADMLYRVHVAERLSAESRPSVPISSEQIAALAFSA